MARVSPLSPRQRCARAAPVPGFAVSESEDVHGKLKGVIYQCWSPEAQGLSGTKKSHPSQWGSELPFVLVFSWCVFWPFYFSVGAGAARGSSVEGSTGGWGAVGMDGATLLPLLYGNLSPLLCFLVAAACVSRSVHKEGAQLCPPSFSPCPPSVPVCLYVCVCAHPCADLIVCFFITFSFPNVYGPWDWK